MNLPPEIWSTIAEAIDAGSDWKSFIFTCQLFSQFNNDKKIIHFANPLATLIKRLPNHDWDWLSIVNNPWMNDDIIEKIASFPTFKPTKEAILVQLDGYNSQILLINNNDSTIMDFTNVSIDMIRKYHPRKRLHGLSAVADLELILANPDLNWVWKEV